MTNAAQRIAEEDLDGLSEEQRRILADQTEVDLDEPLDPELLAALHESDEQIARGEVVDADVVLADVDAILFGS